MNAVLESLLVPEGSTWTYFYRRLDLAIPFNWHYHLEYELTFTTNSIGQRYVGDSIEAYGDGDLALLGSNLPHSWMSQDKADREEPHLAHVFWIKPDWIHRLIDSAHELKPIKAMLLGSSQGLVFSSASREAVRPLIEGMRHLSPAARVGRLIEILSILADARDCRPLCAPRAEHEPIRVVDRPRIDRALEYIHQNYHTDILISDLAELASLSVSGLHRLFKRHARRTVGSYITQLRIGKACSLLVSTSKPVACIAEDVGYTNLSHFNRQFKAVKAMTPREFRQAFAPHGAPFTQDRQAKRSELRTPMANARPAGAVPALAGS